MAIKRNNGWLRKLRGERWVILSCRDVSAPLSMFWMIWSLAYCLTVGRVDVCVMHMLWGSCYAPPAPTNAFSPQKKEITHCQEKQQMLIILIHYWEAHVEAVFRSKVFFFFSTSVAICRFQKYITHFWASQTHSKPIWKHCFCDSTDTVVQKRHTSLWGNLLCGG